ncbi:MAG: tRNA (N(6)-L-threonylcarbamoyladenosine(37)-C(2))-methylthiotransferase MtaB [Pseudomonadota bacterium]
MSAEIVNLGCRLNIREGEAMRALVPDDSDLIIVNSCAVTDAAVRTTRRTIRRLKRERPGARIAVTGCAAQIDPEGIRAMPEVARVVGNVEKLNPSAWAREAADGDIVSDIMRVRQVAPHLVPAAAPETTTRAFVEIQNGCDHRCTFCIIPYGRGNARSVPAGRVVEEVRALVAMGVREIVLTGVDLTSYGPDLPGAPTLGGLVARVLKLVPDLPRLRLSSLDVAEVDEELADLIAHETRLMPHLHLSLQAGDDMILTRMKRRHRRADAIDLVRKMKAARPEIAIGADIIAGFPTETDAMFENSVRLIDECDIVFAHVFPYSARAGTPAARMPQVPMAVRKARAARLREAAAARRDRWYTGLVGKYQRVLVEGDGTSGHTDAFAPVMLARAAARGEIVDAAVTGLRDGKLTARMD